MECHLVCQQNVFIHFFSCCFLCGDQGNSFILAHAGHKWQSPKWVPGAWGYSWATCPGGYKYGGLALQVGGWVTGWQPIIITKLTVRKPKLWPLKERSKNVADWQRSIKDTSDNNKDLMLWDKPRQCCIRGDIGLLSEKNTWERLGSCIIKMRWKV
jgi:hypothetical protein